MPKYQWVGGTTNLGRFGTVKHGDVLNLTEKEEESMLGNGPKGTMDPRIKVIKDGKEPEKLEAAGLDLPEGYERLPKGEQAAVLRKVQEDNRRRKEQLDERTNPALGNERRNEDSEEARRERLAKANAETNEERYRQMTKAELWEVIEAKRREGQEIDVKRDATRATLLKAALASEGHGTEDIDENDDQE